MNFTTIFIKRPVMTTLVMIGILVFGIVAYRQLAVSDLPNVDFPTITVSATLPGTSPQTMAATVATPLEKAFSTIAGIDNMTSTSSLGQSQIVIQFALDRDIDAAAQDVQAAISQTIRQLPQGIIPPSYQKTNPADAPILTLALTSTEVPLSTLDEFGETTLAQRLSMVGGVAQVLVYGAQKYAVRIQLDPSQLATRGIALEDVASAVTNQNVNMPTGVLWGPKTALTIQATGQLDNASAFKDLIVAYRNGAPVHLTELGRITDDVQNNKTASWYDGARSIVLAIQRQPGTNTVDVANKVKAALTKLQTEIPPSVKVSTLYDRSATIQASVQDVTFTLELTLVLVVLVIFLFLRNISATVIPSLALPMSIIGTFSVMYLLHYSLDNLSLMALTLAVGFVVDDAIVMLENIVRHLEMGKPRMEAAIDGAAEVGFTILSMTLSLAAVFIPFLFMGGIIGKLFHEFAVTIGVAILVSGFVSLTLTPMLSSRFLRSEHGREHGRLYQTTERFYDRTLDVYERSLAWVMARRTATLVFSLVILVATAWLFWST
ncbi:MAG TPA: efflux RND transporter permease subunit, partial [Gemmatimonadaceae bacterium]|nr:efflux RND transporter permease subunit [Gemmatimonadaceae bacterium]